MISHSTYVQTRFYLLDEVFRAAYGAFPTLDHAPVPCEAEAFRLQLHLSIIEMTAACLGLFSGRFFSPIPILIRVSYEALADQAILARDPSYADRMLRTAMDECRELPDLMNQHGFGMLQKFLVEPGARAFLGRLKQESRDLEKKTSERLSVEEKFEAAGMGNEYLMHRLMSGHVHNDVAALAGRHATKLDNGAVRYEIFKVPGEPDLCGSLGVAAGVLLRSCEAMHRGKPDFRPYSLRLGALLAEDRARWPEHSNLGHYEKPTEGGAK